MSVWMHLWPGGTWWSGFDALWPNIAASIIIGIAAYFWKIKPHLDRQNKRHDNLMNRINELHNKVDGEKISDANV